jgi:hypothetical protein
MLAVQAFQPRRHVLRGRLDLALDLEREALQVFVADAGRDGGIEPLEVLLRRAGYLQVFP